MATSDALFLFGEYSLRPLRVIGEQVAVRLFADISQRGNPLLQGKPMNDLERLGVALYRKALDFPSSSVVFKGAEPIGLLFMWDVAVGGAWGGETPPRSLAIHNAIGAAVLASQNGIEPGRVAFGAFMGVVLPHPGALCAIATFVSFDIAAKSGCSQILWHSVHPAVTASDRKIPFGPEGRRWEIPFASIEMGDADLQAELAAAKPGFALCTLADIAAVQPLVAMRPYIQQVEAARKKEKKEAAGKVFRRSAMFSAL